jgi:hypothetical protein
MHSFGGKGERMTEEILFERFSWFEGWEFSIKTLAFKSI